MKKARLFSTFCDAVPGSVKVSGHLDEFLKRQYRGLTGNYREMGYPYDTCLWEGEIENVHFTEGVYRGFDIPVPSLDGAWWPYEQAAYLLDGMIRLSLLEDTPELFNKFKDNLDYVLDHPDENGQLGHCFHPSSSEWPMAVFFKAVIAYYEAYGDEKTLAAFRRHYDSLSIETVAKPGRNITNIEGLLKLYEWTGDDKFRQKAVDAYSFYDKQVEMADSFYGDLNLSKLESGCRLTVHGVSFSEMLKLPVMLYIYTGEEYWLKIAQKGLDKACLDHEQPVGQLSCNEFLSGRDPLQGFETCVTSDMMWTLGYFVMADGAVSYADRMEKLAYNALPGAITKDFTALQYLSAVNQVNATPFSNNTHMGYAEAAWRQYRPDQFPQCCPGNLQRIMPNFAMKMWMRKNGDNAPVAMLYGPSVYTSSYQGDDFEIEEDTQYPFRDDITFRFSVSHGFEMPFYFRIPHWAKTSSLLVNGKAVEMELKPGTIQKIIRYWRNGDEVVLTLSPEITMKHDRQWCWIERGALNFSYAVPAEEIRESDSPFSPRSYNPTGPWNYSLNLSPDEVSKINMEYQESSYPFECPSVLLKVPARQIKGYDSLDSNRFTPRVPLYNDFCGEREMITLQPYATTITRVTAFPDGKRRVQLPVVAAYVQGPFPYNQKIPLSTQKFAPQNDGPEIYRKCPIVQRDSNMFFDLAKHFKVTTNHLAYLMFRFWSDYEEEAVFALGAASSAQCFINGNLVFSMEGLNEAELMEPQWFRRSVTKGYNYLLVKVAVRNKCDQYRHEWGAKLDVFIER